MGTNNTEHDIEHDLIITIVNKGLSSDVIDASKEAGAEGGTILHGRGSGVHDTAKLFGIRIEPEKEVILTLVENTKTDLIVESISKKLNINKPGKGVLFVIDVKRVAGIHHLIKHM